MERDVEANAEWCLVDFGGLGEMELGFWVAMRAVKLSKRKLKSGGGRW